MRIEQFSYNYCERDGVGERGRNRGVESEKEIPCVASDEFTWLMLLGGLLICAEIMLNILQL